MTSHLEHARRLSVAATALFAALALSGVVGASASAAPSCYATFFPGRGNYSDSNCTNKVAVLTGDYVLAELIFKKVGRVWCAKLGEFTGEYQSGTCTTLETNGLYTRVVTGAKGAEIVTLPSEGTPVTISVPAAKVKAKLESASGGLIEAEGYSLSLSFPNLEDMAAGTYLAAFSKAEEAKEKAACNTPGDAEGEVLLPTSTVLLAFDSLSALGVGALFSVSEVAIECAKGAIKIKIKGSSLSLVTPINEEIVVESTKLHDSLHCASTGTPAETKYWNESGEPTAVPALLMNFGSGFVKSCEELTSEPTLLPSKMIEISG